MSPQPVHLFLQHFNTSWMGITFLGKIGDKELPDIEMQSLSLISKLITALAIMDGIIDNFLMVPDIGPSK
jgi:hypothetical protein